MQSVHRHIAALDRIITQLQLDHADSVQLQYSWSGPRARGREECAAAIRDAIRALKIARETLRHAE